VHVSVLHELLANKPLVDALLDRPRHHRITIRIDGPSPREPAPPAASETPVQATAPEPILSRASRSARKLLTTHMLLWASRRAVGRRAHDCLA
jgi:hypothetical protein